MCLANLTERNRMMLVLSRRQGEGIVIDGPCVVTVAQIQGNRVKVTIEAERGVKVLRKELCDDEADRAIEAVKG
jgi:carbon storage regulator CsrA